MFSYFAATGKVDKINPFGAFVYLDKNIHGLAHVSEFQEIYPGKKMEEVIQAGEEYSWKILSIEPKDHRMGLVLLKNGKEDKKEKNPVVESSVEVVDGEKEKKIEVTAEKAADEKPVEKKNVEDKIAADKDKKVKPKAKVKPKKKEKKS